MLPDEETKQPAGTPETSPDAQAEPADAPREEGEPPDTETPAHQPPDEQAAPKSAPRFKCLVNYGKMFNHGYFVSFFDRGLKRGARVVVKTSRGTELGRIVVPPQPIPENENPVTDGRVLRAAVAEDIVRATHIEEHDEERDFEMCQRKIEEHNLDMELVEVEHVLGGEKIIFYFMAEHRVDFRGLVKDLAREFHTRIELRQVGVRDEAKLLSDYEHCGQQLCCRSFLRELAPVGMKMAKTQRTTLDPGKISGCCGRLMCCLRFEEDTYRKLLSAMPKRGAVITFQGNNVKIVDVDPIGDRLIVATEDGAYLTVKRSDTSAAAPAGEEVSGAEQAAGDEADEAVTVDEELPKTADEMSAAADSDRLDAPQSPSEASAGAQQPQATGSEKDGGEQGRRRKRRRRPRHKRRQQ